MMEDQRRAIGDPERLAALERSGLVGTPPEEAFDRLTRVAARLLRAPVALLSLVDQERQHFKSQVGLDEPELSDRVTDLTHSFCQHIVATRQPLVVSDALADRRVQGNEAIAALGVRAYAGAAVRDESGHILGALCVIDRVPRRWDDDELTMLDELADAASAEVRLRAAARQAAEARRLLALALDAAEMGVWQWEVDAGRVVADERVARLFGLAPPEAGAIHAYLARLHPDDEPKVRAALERAAAGSETLDAEFRVRTDEGTWRWLRSWARAVGGDGRSPMVAGVTRDTTQQRSAAERITRTLRSMSDAFLSLDTDWRFTYVNERAEELLGRPATELVGTTIWEAFPPTVGSRFQEQYEQAMQEQRAVSFEEEYAPLGRCFDVRAFPAPDGLSVYFRDVTSRRRADEERAALLAAERDARRAAEQAGERLTVLARMTEVLTSTLDVEEALRRLARLLVPRLADWSVVDLLTAPDQVARVAIAHPDPSLTSRHQVGPLPPLPSASQAPLARVLRGAGPILLDGVPPGEPDSPLDAAHLALLRDLGVASAIVAPLRGRREVVGAFVMARTDPDRPYGPDDLALADDLGRRAGLAVDNARLFAVEQHTAEVLQRSMLSPLPQRAGLELAARYQPAAERAEVGGDWYDAFPLRDGATALVIGDVAGHDIDAAVRMGHLRNQLRAIAVDTGAPPSQVITRVNRVLDQLDVIDIATVVYACLSRDGGGWRLCWSNAGHPSPLLIDPDGAARLLDHPADPLLGVEADDRSDRSVRLAPGATVLLYTDGLVEQRGRELDVGLTRLLAHAARLADLSLHELCDGLLAAVAASCADDIALLAVRVGD